MNRRTLLAVTLALLAGCGGGSPTQPPPTQNPSPSPGPGPAPAPTTFTLSGTVSISAPSASTRLPGAVVQIADGPFAGRSATADADGAFSITGLTGGLSVNAARSGYQTQGLSATMTANRTLAFQLRPNATTITETLTGDISGGISTTCVHNFSPKPCRIHTLNIHNDGPITADLTWTGGSADLDLALWRGTTEVADSSGVGSSERISAHMTGGSSYQLRVVYYGGSNIVNYSLRLTRPN